MHRHWQPGAGMARSSCGRWSVAPCSGLAGKPRASKAWLLVPMDTCSPVAGMMRSFSSGMRHPATCVKTLTGHTNWVEGLAFAPDGTQLTSASVDRTVKLWEVTSGCCLQTLEGHTDRVFAVAWSPDGCTVASAGFDKMIWLWEVERGNYRMALQGHTARMYKIAFTHDSRSLLGGSEDSALRVWDVASGQ